MDQAMSSEEASASCGCGCSTKPPRFAKAEVLLGLALLLALTAEAIALATREEQTAAVLILSLAAILLGGIETFKRALASVASLTLNINFLMCLAVVGAFVIGSYPEAAMVIVLFAIAERIESFALDHARNAVRSLMTLAPETALAQREGAWAEVDAGTIQLGEVIRVRPGDRIALDGVVLKGSSSVNQAPITGESAPLVKDPGDPVYAGTINQEGLIEVQVTGVKGSTTLDRIIRTVQDAQASRAPTQRFIDAFARYYTPGVVVAAALTAVVPLFFGQPFVPWLYKALVILVISCPCALVISTPVTVVSGLAAAARRGILIKGGAHLESARALTSIALDKTGTLTKGEPEVAAVVPLHGEDEAWIRQAAASLEAVSSHPIARAIAGSWAGDLLSLESVQAIPGRGVEGRIGGRRLILGSPRFIEERGVSCDHVSQAIADSSLEGASLVLLADDRQTLGIFFVQDALRSTTQEAVADLERLGLRVMMLSGDNEATAHAIARRAGIGAVKSDLLPDDKLEIIKGLQRAGEKVGMVGDGINDAPALAAANVGFAMGAAGSDAAIETADVALMNDDLRRLPDTIRLSRRTAAILSQNISLAVGIKFVFFALALAGHATLWMAVFADMGSSLLVIGNGLRLLRIARSS